MISSVENSGTSGCSSFQPRTCSHHSLRAFVARRLGRLDLGEDLVELGEHALGVADDGEIGGAVLADLGGVDVDVDDLGVGSERGQAAGDAVVETDAERDEEIGLGHAHVGGIGAVHAGHAEEVGVGARQRAETHEGADGGSVEDFHELAEFFMGARSDDAAAGVDEGPLGFPHHVRGAADLPGVAIDVNLVTGQVNGGHGRVLGVGLEDILGHVHQDRAGPSGFGDVEGFVDGSAEGR